MRPIYQFFGGIALALVAVCLQVPATAADFTTKAIPYITAAPAYNWTGFYAGIHAGYANADVTVRDTNGGVAPGPFSYHADGFLGGGQFGYSKQFGWLVIGIEADASYVNLNGGGTIGSASATSHQNLSTDSGFLGDVTGRAGVAFDRFYIYGKGGGAYYSGSSSQVTTNLGYVPTGTGDRTGWVAGVGAEYYLGNNWTVKGEYLHYDLGSATAYQTNAADPSSPSNYRFYSSHELTFDTFRAGVNYKFTY